jgi:hypothetical protein
MAEHASVAARAAEPTPENPIRAQRQQRSIKRASQKFEETTADLKSLDRRARVEVDPSTGWARAVRGKFSVGRPPPAHVQRSFRSMISAKELGDHPTVVFLDRFSALFGLDEPSEQLFLRGITPLAQGDWFAFGIDIFAVGRGAAAQIDVVVAPNGDIIYAGFGQAGQVPERQ